MSTTTTIRTSDTLSTGGRSGRRNRRRTHRQPAGYKVAFDLTAKAEPARGRAREEEERHSALQGWRAAAASPYTWDVCDAFTHNNTATPTGGRPRQYPDWLLFFMLIAVPMFGGSVRSASTLFDDPAEWDRFTRHVHPYIPAGWTSPLTGLPKSDNAVQDAADQRTGTRMAPPSRHHIAYFLFCWRGKPVGAKKPPPGIGDVRKRLMRAFLDAAMQQTFAEGRLNNRRFALDHPNPAHAVNFDGTVFAFRLAKTATPDEPGMDTHLGMHVTGTGKQVYGSKFVFASTRTGDYKARIILDLQHVPGKKNTDADDEHSSETKAVIDILERALPTAPGIRVITVDSALRGRGIEHVHALGPVVVNDPHVARKADDEAGKPAIPKDHVVHTIQGDRGCQHRIYYQHGAPYEHTLNVDGNAVLAPLTIREYERRQNKNRTHRHYHVLTVPCPDGDHHPRIALFHQPDNGLAFNRGEYVRVVPPGSDLHKAWYGLRNDTEALHNEIKSRRIRLPRNSVTGQQLLLLAYAVGQNAIAHAFAQQRAGRPNALDNTA